MKNRYEIRGETTIIFIESRKHGTVECLIDTEDLEKVQLPNNRRWYLSNKRTGLYVCNKERIWLPGKEKPWDKVIYLHRVILGDPPPGKTQVDHINHDTLDNRKVNLRWANHSENGQNPGRPRSHGRLGITGVSYISRYGKYMAQGHVNGKTTHLGTFDTIEEALKARLEWEKKYMPYSTRVRKGDSL